MGPRARHPLMDLEALRRHFLAKPGATEGYPFGPGALVLKVGGKVFGIVGDEADPLTVSLKCDPEIAHVLRDSYVAVTPGYHLNKRHWNTVILDGSIDDDLVRDWIDDSYDLVFHALPKRVQAEIAAQTGAG